MSPKIELIIRVFITFVISGLIFLANAYLFSSFVGYSEQNSALGMIAMLTVPVSIVLAIGVLILGIKSARNDYHHRMRFGDEPVDLEQLAIETQRQLQQLQEIEERFEEQEKIRRAQNKNKKQTIGFNPIFGTFVLKDE